MNDIKDESVPEDEYIPETVSYEVSEAELDAADMPSDSVDKSAASPEDIAAYDFQQLLPKYNNAIKYLGKNSAQRVLKALIEYPLENNQPKFLSVAEKTAFYYGVQLLDVRHVIWNALLKMQSEKAAAEAAEKEAVNE